MVFPVEKFNVTAATENESLIIMFYIKCIPFPAVHTVFHTIMFKEYKLQMHTGVIVASYMSLSNSTSLDCVYEEITRMFNCNNVKTVVIQSKLLHLSSFYFVYSLTFLFLTGTYFSLPLAMKCVTTCQSIYLISSKYIKT
jgi:hypothetical protein